MLLVVNVVSRGLPFQCTIEPAVKPVPITVNENAPLPGATLVGIRGWLTNGTGSGTGACAYATITPSNVTNMVLT